MREIHPGHIVCIFGGAVAGSEAAQQLARRGIYSVVIDQEPLPYGKIEHGLPKWHIKLRDKEERLIDQRLSDPHIRFVPSTRLGDDVSLAQVLEKNFSAVLLAIGAWKDRPLPVAGVDDYLDRGFYYQNPFVMWFNQYHSPAYQGPDMEIHDDAIVVGGGLASLDVVKILMLESTLRRLEEMGLKSNLFTLDKKGIPKVLADLGTTTEALGLKGCRLFYRRRVIDMPLNEVPAGVAEAKAERLRQVRAKLLKNFQSKYLFSFEPLNVPVSTITEGGRLAGLVFQKTEIRDGRAVALEGTEFEARSPLVISSIGSLPEPLSGLEMDGNLLNVKDEDTGKVEGFSNVFALGNTVTGRGNIRASLVHGRQVAGHLMDSFLDWSEGSYSKLVELPDQGRGASEFAASYGLKSVDQISEIFAWATELQKRKGFDGDYETWATENRPQRLEDLIGYER